MGVLGGFIHMHMTGASMQMDCRLLKTGPCALEHVGHTRPVPFNNKNAAS